MRSQPLNFVCDRSSEDQRREVNTELLHGIVFEGRMEAQWEREGIFSLPKKSGVKGKKC